MNNNMQDVPAVEAQWLGGKSSKRRTHAVIRLNLRLANPTYVDATRSGKTEAVVKVASYARGFRVKTLMEYVGRTEQGRNQNEQVLLEDHRAFTFKGPHDLDKIYNEWSITFDRAKPGSRRLPRHATHIIFSAKAENSLQNLRKVLAAAREVAQDHFRDNGYDFLIGLHQDADYPHVHFVVRNKNREPGGKKLKLNPADLFIIREDFAKKLSCLQLEHVATLRRDRPSELDKLRRQIKTGLEKVEKRHRQFQRAMARSAPNKDAFIFRQVMSRDIVRFREKVKVKTQKGTKERLELLGSIRRLERSLVRKDKDINKELEVTVKGFVSKLGQDALVYRNELNQLTGGYSQPEHKKLTVAQVEGKKRFYDREIARLERDLKQTREAISCEPELSAGNKQTVLDVLHFHEKAMKGRVVEYELDKLTESITDDMKLYMRSKKENINPTTGEHPKTAVERLYARREIDKLAIRIDKRILDAMKKIVRSAASPDYKRKAFGALRNHHNILAKDRGMERSR